MKEIQDKPTDAEILETMRKWGGRSATYVIKNRLQSRGYPVQTPWVLRQMKRLEQAGEVIRVPSSYAVMLTWMLPTPKDT